jgi:ferredoxin
LSLAAKVAPYRRQITESCSQCGACATVCPMGHSSASHAQTECLSCRRCEAACPEQAIAFRLGLPSTGPARRCLTASPIDPWRRRLVLGLGSFALGGAAGYAFRGRSSRSPLRPPGAGCEARFAARCVGCGTCLFVCPTGGLQPLVSARRLDTAFSPRLVPRVGPCLPRCTACAEACPTGAIADVKAEKKGTLKIGLAVLDRARCLPWAGGDRCVICLDACPLDYRAIELRRTPTGEFRPHVKETRCTGCGICEFKCPVDGDSAIQVVARSDLPAMKLRSVRNN